MALALYCLLALLQHIQGLTDGAGYAGAAVGVQQRRAEFGDVHEVLNHRDFMGVGHDGDFGPHSGQRILADFIAEDGDGFVEGVDAVSGHGCGAVQHQDAGTAGFGVVDELNGVGNVVVGHIWAPVMRGSGAVCW